MLVSQPLQNTGEKALYVLACGVIIFLDYNNVEMIERSVLTYLAKKDFMEKEVAEDGEGKVNPI